MTEPAKEDAIHAVFQDIETLIHAGLRHADPETSSAALRLFSALLDGQIRIEVRG